MGPGVDINRDVARYSWCCMDCGMGTRASNLPEIVGHLVIVKERW
jgi:hypothetical protein